MRNKDQKDGVAQKDSLLLKQDNDTSKGKTLVTIGVQTTDLDENVEKDPAKDDAENVDKVLDKDIGQDPPIKDSE